MCLQVVTDPSQQGKLMQVLDIAWSKVLEEIKSWSYWLKMEAYVSLVLQPVLLEQPKGSPVADFIIEVGITVCPYN
jgi:hypothetical protein